MNKKKGGLSGPKWPKIFEKSKFLPKIVTCLTIKYENEGSLSDKDVPGFFGDKEFVKNRGSLGESWWKWGSFSSERKKVGSFWWHIARNPKLSAPPPGSCIMATPNKSSWTILISAFGTRERRFITLTCLMWVFGRCNKAVLEPRVSPDFAITYFCNHCNIRFENTDQSMWIHTLTLFSKNLNQRSLTPRWPLTPCLLRSHVWLYPRIIVSKSHDNTSMYVDTVINFAKYHIHTYTYYVQNEWSHSLLLNSVQARQTWR